MVSVPLDTVSPAIGAISNVLTASAAPAAVLGFDRSVKFVTEEMKGLFGEVTNVRQIENAIGAPIADLTKLSTSTVSIHHRKMLMSIVPFAAGAAVVFRQMAEIEAPPQISDIPKVAEVIRSVVNRSLLFAELKGITLEVSIPDFAEQFRHHDKLADALEILLDNSLHYVSSGGQVVIGVRPMDHKGKAILLFFVMDNGPLVPEHMKHVIFESGFIWNPNAHERSGQRLFKVREFSAAHGGSVWVESKSGKACTFFLRLDPDPPRG
jgi:signal transduction histidine kinase